MRDTAAAAAAKALRGVNPHPSIGRAKACRFCGRTLGLLEHYSGAVCGDPACRRRHLDGELEHYRSRAGELSGRNSPRDFAIIVVPHRREALATAAAARRTALQDHLTQLCASRAGPPVEEESCDCAHDETRAQSQTHAEPPGAAVCAACRGYCCYHGGRNFAFLDAQAIGRFAAAQPEMSADEVVAAYLGYLPARAYEDSCLYHAAAGCTLPRSMRSATCNDYACGPLREAERILRDERAPGLFVVERHDHRIVGGAFIDLPQRQETPGAQPQGQRALVEET
ncbi:MAG: hypothetical protein IT531_25335 [Burkholderiales bacterium]|nr:hypothetical protein [Burkholderiales bacterium]